MFELWGVASEGEELRRFPLLMFADSGFIGGAGICSSDGVICVALDFPLWFVVFTVLHELVHYIFCRLPKRFGFVVCFEVWMERFTEWVISFLSNCDREKAVLDLERIYGYIRWEQSVFG